MLVIRLAILSSEMQIDIPSPASTFRHWSPVKCRARGTDCSSVSQACRKSWLSRVMFVCVSRWGLVTAGGFLDDRITWLVVVVLVLQIHPLARQYRAQPGPSFQSERIFLQSFYILVNYIIFPPKKVTHRIILLFISCELEAKTTVFTTCKKLSQLFSAKTNLERATLQHTLLFIFKTDRKNNSEPVPI